MERVRRRTFLQSALGFGGGLASAGNQRIDLYREQIDRRALVRRHNPVVTSFEKFSPLSVGNGEFAFTADLTGLQTYPDAYESGIPLCTQSQWGWHSFPAPGGKGAGDLVLEEYDTHGRMVGYPTRREGQEELYNWLRESPHRLNLGRIGLELTHKDGTAVERGQLAGARQNLDLWTGIGNSRFLVDGESVTVTTACHPTEDLVAVVIESPLIASGRVAVRLEFPYGSPATNASNWDSPDKHLSRGVARSSTRFDIERRLDDDRYSVTVAWQAEAAVSQEGPHRFILRAVPGATILALICRFTRGEPEAAPPSAAATMEASRRHWEGFWSSGAAVDLGGSTDPRARELERRIILSQYLTAIQCSGSMPPQETGLTCNSWYGKFHLEMHWWHAAHFAMWGRSHLLLRSLDWYSSILPSARLRAREQGYSGARWPKMADPEGRDSPSPIGPLLIWQQPHPIAYAELCYQAMPTRATLNRFRDIVFDSAEFMASYAFLDPSTKRYVLGPPVIPAQEIHRPRETWNPTYELAYWGYGLGVAQKWRRRLGIEADQKWDAVRASLSPLPVRDGLYLAHENRPHTFSDGTTDHPSMLAALGVLPGSGVEPKIMRATLRKVMEVWKWETTWGWDYPMVAMTAARVGEPEIAVDALMLDTPKNSYLPNGHNYQRPNLPLYLPGNGGLLAAIATMAGGWESAPRPRAAGFPKRGWSVRAEGFGVVG